MRGCGTLRIFLRGLLLLFCSVTAVFLVGKDEEPPPVQPRPLDTLPRSPTPELEMQPPPVPPGHPLPGSPLLGPARGVGMHRVDGANSIATRPLPAPPPTDSMSPFPTSGSYSRLSSHQTHHMPLAHGYPMGAGQSSTLPSGGMRGHHDYINADLDLQRPEILAQLSPHSPHFGGPPPSSRSFPSPMLADRGNYPSGYQDRMSQLDDHYVSFQKVIDLFISVTESCDMAFVVEQEQSQGAGKPRGAHSYIVRVYAGFSRTWWKCYVLCAADAFW